MCILVIFSYKRRERKKLSEREGERGKETERQDKLNLHVVLLIFYELFLKLLFFFLFSQLLPSLDTLRNC